MLIEAGFLSQEQLKQALENKKRTDLKLGQFLVHEGIVREEQIVNTLSTQLGLERYFPDKFPIDVSLISVIPADFARKYEIAPLQKKTHLMIIAMADPTDINALDAVEELTGKTEGLAHGPYTILAQLDQGLDDPVAERFLRVDPQLFEHVVLALDAGHGLVDVGEDGSLEKVPGPALAHHAADFQPVIPGRAVAFFRVEVLPQWISAL